MNKNNIQNSAELFLYKATIDLNSAKYLLSGYEKENLEIDIEKIYFELQQSAEKLLKSILSLHRVKFPKSHDIEQLTDLCKENNIILVDDIELLIELSDYAVEGRYSIIHDDINESNKYIEILDNIVMDISNNN